MLPRVILLLVGLIDFIKVKVTTAANFERAGEAEEAGEE